LNLTSASHVAIFGRADGFKNVVSFSLFILQSLEPLVNKIYPSAAAALKGIVADGQLMAVGGFGLCGIPEALIDALRDSAVKNLTVISNNAGVDGFGLGILLETRQITKMISSYVGDKKDLQEFKFFKKNGKWKNGCPFYLEDPFVEIPAMCESKFTNYMLDNMK